MISLPTYNKGREVEGITIWIFVVVLLAIFLFAPLTLRFEVTEKRFSLSAKAAFFRVWQFDTSDKKKKEPAKKNNKKKDSSSKKKTPTDLLKLLRTVLRIITRVLKHVHLLPRIRHLIFRLKFGLSDAASTGMAAGGIYGLVYGIQARIHRSRNVRVDEVTVTPVFEAPTFSVECSGIITTCLAHIMGIAIVVLAVLAGQKNKED